MNVLVYARVSKDRFGDERSPARQEAACRSYAEAREWVVVSAHRDVDASAFKPSARPGLDAVLDLVAAGGVDAIIVWKLDRLVRRSRDFERIWSICETTGTALVSVTEPIDTSTELGLAFVRILVTFATLESANKSERLRAAYREEA
ncbi:MAG TPA: recombinase family protein, partial [Acidimicrobiales bacterium]|nr:recombinase family protein [Acidimicrobiales bacterium]